MTRESLQKSVILSSDNSKNILLAWATSVGKTRAAIGIQDRHKPVITLLAVAEIAHIENWKEEYKKWGKQSLLYHTEIFCHASLKHYANREVDLLIIDEGHHMSVLRMDILSTIKAKRVIVLTATISDSKIEELEETFGKFMVSKVFLEKAIKQGWLPTPKIYLVPLELTNNPEHLTEILVEEWGQSDKRITIKCRLFERWKYLKNKKEYPNVRLEMKCTQVEKNNYLDDKFEYWKQRFFSSQQEWAKTKWMLSGSERKRFIGECKTPHIKLLLKKLKDRRYICFCASINQAESLGDNCIHSKKKESQDLIKQFNSKKISHLIAVNMLQEGQNLESLEVGIIGQLDGQERSFIQRFGRTLRAEDPIQIIFYYPDTRDEEYLLNALDGINPEYIYEVSNITEIQI